MRCHCGIKYATAADLDRLNSRDTQPDAPAVSERRATVILSEDATDRRWRWITSDQFLADCRVLASALPWPCRGIAGVPRGGLLAASWIASWLNIPLYSLNPDGVVLLPSSSRRLKESQFTGPLVVVDDDVFSGLTLDKAIKRLGEEVLTATVYAWTNSQKPVDLCVRRFPCTWMCEWRFFSAGAWAQDNTGMDFDGILCRDCLVEEDDDGPRYQNFLRTAAPLYLPRPRPVPLIVTARREAYRAETEDWLARHGISCQRLVMGPWQSLRERTAEWVIRLKAETWAATKLKFFVESDVRQAAAIAKMIPRPVICPAAGRVFNDELLTQPTQPT